MRRIGCEIGARRNQVLDAIWLVAISGLFISLSAQ